MRTKGAKGVKPAKEHLIALRLDADVYSKLMAMIGDKSVSEYIRTLIKIDYEIEHEEWNYVITPEE